MKKFFLILITGAIFFSCSLETDDEIILYEMAPIVEAELPETFVHGETYNLLVHYNKPSSCHAFDGFDLTREENEIRIGIVNAYFPENANCEIQTILTEASLEFYVDRDDFYIFKFWQTENENGEPQFLTIEVPVEE